MLAAGEQWGFLEMPCQEGGSLLLPEKLLLTSQRQDTEHSMKASFVIVQVKHHSSKTPAEKSTSQPLKALICHKEQPKNPPSAPKALHTSQRTTSTPPSAPKALLYPTEQFRKLHVQQREEQRSGVSVTAAGDRAAGNLPWQLTQ